MIPAWVPIAHGFFLLSIGTAIHRLTKGIDPNRGIIALRILFWICAGIWALMVLSIEVSFLATIIGGS